MKSVYEIIRESGAEQGVDVMWETTRMISDAVEKYMPDDARERLNAQLYGRLSGGHYNEEFAMEAAEAMYYTDDSGNRHSGPYWTEPQVKEWYRGVKSEIPGYNCWDFYVTLHMVASDNRRLLSKWFPSESREEMDKRFVSMAVNWLRDEDWKGEGKIWHYLNG